MKEGQRASDKSKEAETLTDSDLLREIDLLEEEIQGKREEREIDVAQKIADALNKNEAVLLSVGSEDKKQEWEVSLHGKKQKEPIVLKNIGNGKVENHSFASFSHWMENRRDEGKDIDIISERENEDDGIPRADDHIILPLNVNGKKIGKLEVMNTSEEAKNDGVMGLRKPPQENRASNDAKPVEVADIPVVKESEAKQGVKKENIEEEKHVADLIASIEEEFQSQLKNDEYAQILNIVKRASKKIQVESTKKLEEIRVLFELAEEMKEGRHDVADFNTPQLKHDFQELFGLNGHESQLNAFVNFVQNQAEDNVKESRRQDELKEVDETGNVKVAASIENKDFDVNEPHAISVKSESNSVESELDDDFEKSLTAARAVLEEVKDDYTKLQEKEKEFFPNKTDDGLEGEEKVSSLTEAIETIEGMRASENLVSPEQQGLLEELRGALDMARKDYVSMHSKKANLLSDVKKYFGWFGKNESGKTENDEEVEYMLAYYQNALLSYKNARLDMVRAEKLSPEEIKEKLVEVLDEIDINERINLYNERRDAEASPWMLDRMKGVIDGYRELSTAKKLLLSGGLLASGMALGATGGMAGGVAGMAVFIARRGFGGAVAGEGMFQMLEARQQSKYGAEASFNKNAFQEQFEGEVDIEKMLGALNEKLDASIHASDKRLESMMQNRFKNAAAGIGLAAFIAVGGMNWLAEKTHIADGMKLVAEKLHLPEIANSISERVSNVINESGDQALPEQHINEAVQNSSGESVEASQKQVASHMLYVEPGSGKSIEGNIIHHLMGKDGIDGISKEEVGVKAHKMVLDYVKSHKGVSVEKLSHILSGEVQLSSGPEGLYIENITLPSAREMASHAVDMHSRTEFHSSGIHPERIVSNAHEAALQAPRIEHISPDAWKDTMNELSKVDRGKLVFSFTDMLSESGDVKNSAQFFLSQVGMKGATFERVAAGLKFVGIEESIAKKLNVLNSAAMEVLGTDTVNHLHQDGSKDVSGLLFRIIGQAQAEGKTALLQKAFAEKLKTIPLN